MNKLGPFSLAGKLAVITGGGTGIGLGISKAMAESGAKVIIIGRREEILRNAVDEIGHGSSYRCYDMNERKGMTILVETLEDHFGPLDILVNDAGAHLKKFSLETTDQEFDDIVRTNLASVFSLTREW